MYEANKRDRMNKNKNRYDEETYKNAMTKQAHDERLKEATAQESAMMARMQRTMNE